MSHVLPFSFPGVDKVRCCFSTRKDGDLSIGRLAEGSGRNRQIIRKSAGFSFWADAQQVHGTTLLQAVGRQDVATPPECEADGLYTTEPNTGLVIYTGDCQPLLFARKDGKAVAAIHVGWRGNAANFPGTAVARLCQQFACGPEDLVAVRGPSLGPSASEFVNFHQEWPAEFLPWFNPLDKRVNLWALTAWQLRQAGLKDDSIFQLDLCTYTMNDWFFSYRRNKEKQRQAGVIWIMGS